MIFSEYVDSVKIPEFVKDKVKGKEFARSLGIATAKVFNPPGAFIIKPVHGHSARGVVLADSHSTIVEEALADADGSTPPMDYRFHCFRGRARLMQLTKTDRVGGSLVHDFMIYPSFEDMDVCRYPSEKLPFSREVAHEMAVLAEVVSQAARSLYLRVDFYNTTRGIFWGEACVTPGFAVSTNRKISPTADALLGSWITE